MSTPLRDVRSVIAALGGVPTVATMFGITPNAVWNWIGIGQMPAKTYLPMCERLWPRSAPDDLWAWAETADPKTTRSEVAA